MRTTWKSSYNEASPDDKDNRAAAVGRIEKPSRNQRALVRFARLSGMRIEASESTV